MMLQRLPNDILALATTSLFRDFSDRELDAVQRIGTIVDVSPGRIVSRPEDNPEQLVFVVWGQVVGTDGLRRRILGSGDWFGSMDAVRTRTADSEVFETLCATTLFVMNRREFATLRSTFPRVVARMMRVTGMVHPPDLTCKTGRIVDSLAGTMSASNAGSTPTSVSV